jgi:uncharacterized membrane protein YcjF (UPF0283 family)
MVEADGWPAFMLLLVLTALGAWIVLWVAGWRGPEPGTWKHVAMACALGMLVLAALVQSRRERKWLERLQGEARCERKIAAAEARELVMKAERLLPRARAGYAQRQKTRDQRT